MSKRNNDIKPIAKTKGWVCNKYVESVFVDKEPAFLVFDSKSGKVSVEKDIACGEHVYRPLFRHEFGYRPYYFNSEEVKQMLSAEIPTERILSEILRIVRWFVKTHPRNEVLITGEILLTYCQEWISTVHFPFFVGETESGKSTVLHLGGWLAYRCVVSEDWPNADIYNFLGMFEEGSGTICEDEAQEMARNREKVRTYKNSYSKGSVKPRVIMTNSGKYQVFYKIFCCKWFAGENVPQDKGLMERLVIVYMLGGKPRGNLKSATSKEKQYLNKLRNRLLVWKMQNMGNHFPHIDTGLSGRDQELWQDFLSIFHGTMYKSQANEAAEYYLKQRRESISESLEAKIFRIIKPMLKQSMEIESVKIWDAVTNSRDELPGELDERTRKTFYPDEFDRKLTPNSLASIIRFKFQAKKRVTYESTGKGKKTKTTSYVFDKDVVDLLSEKYHAY